MTASPGPVGDGRLAGKTALVTGAGRGIGRAIATGFAAEGARVVLAARTASELEAAADAIEAAGGSAVGVVTDVTDRSAIANVVERAVATFGGLDIVVANAGAVSAGTPTTPVDDFVAVLDVNLTSIYDLALATRPHLAEKGGKFMVTGSGAGRRPFPGGTAYSVSKAAVAMLVRCLAVEWREDKIAVNEIVPGPVRTAMASGIVDAPGLPPAIRLDWHKAPEDVVPMALFLATLPDDGPSGQTFSLLGRDG